MIPETADIQETCRQIAKAIIRTYIDQFKMMNEKDAKELAKLTAKMIINYMQMGGYQSTTRMEQKVMDTLSWLFYAGHYVYSDLSRDLDVTPKDKIMRKTLPTLQLENKHTGAVKKLRITEFYAGPGLKCTDKNGNIFLFEFNDNIKTKGQDWGYRAASTLEVEAYERFLKGRGETRFRSIEQPVIDGNSLKLLAIKTIGKTGSQVLEEKIEEHEDMLKDAAAQISQLDEKVKDIESDSEHFKKAMEISFMRLASACMIILISSSAKSKLSINYRIVLANRIKRLKMYNCRSLICNSN